MKTINKLKESSASMIKNNLKNKKIDLLVERVLGCKLMYIQNIKQNKILVRYKVSLWVDSTFLGLKHDFFLFCYSLCIPELHRINVLEAILD